MAGPADSDHVALAAWPGVGRSFETERSIRLSDAAPDGRLRLDAVARYLQDIADDDSRAARNPNSTAWPNPSAWVVRRTVIRAEWFARYPDSVALVTWCSGLGPRWAERRYSMPGIQAATLWVHVDLDTMRPLAVPDGFALLFGESAQGRVISARLHLPVRPADGDVARTRPWPLRAVDLDVLGHVNNSVYWALVEEQLLHRNRAVAPLVVTLEHHRAIDPGDTVSVAVSDSASGFDLWVATTGGESAAVPETRVAAVARVAWEG